MKRTIAIVLACILITTLALSAALAHAPSGQITAVNGQDATSGVVSFSVAALPTTVNIEGTVTHDNPGNVSPVKLELTDNGTPFYSGSPFEDYGNIGTAVFSVPWVISSAGSHAIEATVSHGNSDGTDTIDVNITLDVVVSQCPAAPSVAAHYLQELGVKAGSALFRNIISIVAEDMGPSTYFDDVAACDPGYEEAVESFVDGILANPVPK